MPIAIQCIVGLGNPGQLYEQTRHNAGVWLLTALLEQYGIKLQPEKKFFGNYATHVIDTKRIHFLMPTTFMNKSGQSVQALINFYKVPLASVLVIHDDLDLLPGQAKLKQGGGHAGHNGLRDMIHVLADPGFWRLRIGIGHPGQREKVSPFVLSPPPQSEREKIDAAMHVAAEIVPELYRGDFDSAMRYLHTKE